MKTGKLLNLLMLVAIFAFIFTGCKKDNSSSSTSTTPTVNTENATAQDAESQDAVSTNVEQNTEDQADALEASNYNTTETKASNGITVTVDHPDTTYFPKIITLTYNYSDTINGEHMSQTGTITLTVSLQSGTSWWRNRIKRVFAFDNFTVTTDSTSFTVNGSRTMRRLSWAPTVSSNKLALNVIIKDSITSDLTIGITDGSFTGSFTRMAARERVYSVNYYKLAVVNRLWHPAYLKDTLTITGIITGINLQDSAYSRLITTPIVYGLCPVYPYNLVAKGVIKDTEGTKVITITYAPDGCENKVTATDANGKTIKVSRKLDRTFRKWW